MAKNNLPKTAKINIQGVELTINQNGRVLTGLSSSRIAYMVAAGQLRVDGGMHFVGLDDLALAFGIGKE